MTREADAHGRPIDVRLLLQRLEPHDREVILRYLEQIENPARCYLSLQGRELDDGNASGAARAAQKT